MPTQYKPPTTDRDGRSLCAVVLAAGEGKRMRSATAKVLHALAGKPLLDHVLGATAVLKPERTIVVVGRNADDVKAMVRDRAECVVQEQQLGSGHAALQARAALAEFSGDLLLLCGDVPLLRSATLESLLAHHRRAGSLATVLTMRVDYPNEYGRVISDGDGHVRIVEHRDATEAERAIHEVNTGTYCFDVAFLFRVLAELGNDNAQGEYYLTDVLEAASRSSAARAVCVDDASEGVGINSRADLARAEDLLRRRLVAHWQEHGVTFIDPATAYISADATFGRDTVVGPNVRLDGATSIGEACTLEGNAYLSDTVVEKGARVRWGVVADRARIGPGAIVGPYSHLRPQADLGEDVHVGNFVEVKKSTIGKRSKANHLSYIGDSTVGEDVNVGAGTITCNYDGFAKHRTVIGDRVQIGSDTQLVAPVELGADSYVAAGTTVTKNVEPGALAFNEKPQKTRSGWVEGFRKRARKEKR